MKDRRLRGHPVILHTRAEKIADWCDHCLKMQPVRVDSANQIGYRAHIIPENSVLTSSSRMRISFMA